MQHHEWSHLLRIMKAFHQSKVVLMFINFVVNMFTFLELVFQNEEINYIFRVPLVITFE